MKRLLWIFSVMALIAGIVLIIGCSDDDETTAPVVKQPGDPDALELEGVTFVADVAGGMDGEMLDFMYFVMDLIFDHPDYPAAKNLGDDQFGPGPGPRPDGRIPRNAFPDLHPQIPLDSFSLTYHEDSEYWFAYIQAVDTEVVDTFVEIWETVGEDSIQFLHGSQVVQWPDSALLTGVNHGVSSIVNSNAWLESVEAHQQISIVGDPLILGDGDITIKGTSSCDANVSTGDVM